MHSGGTLSHKLLRLINHPAPWLLLVNLPAIVLFANRVLIPDQSTDTLSYHLFNGLRQSHHLWIPFSSREFYPVGITNIAPLYDALTSLWRNIFGYRLGTSLTLLAAIGCTWMLYLILKRLLKENDKHFHAGWGLLLVNSTIVLELQFQLATYFIDIINALLILSVLWFVIDTVTKPRKQSISLQRWGLLWFLLGTLAVLKLTNVPLVLPMAALLIWDWTKRHPPKNLKHYLAYGGIMLVFLLPGLPSWLANYRLTGNPVFPYYNAVFHSPDYAQINYLDANFGGNSVAERSLWPITSLAHQQRLGEPHHIYNDYKLLLYWLIAIVIVVLALLKIIKLSLTSRILVFYFLSSTLVWGLLKGIERFFIAPMLLGGLLVVILALNKPSKSNGWRWFVISVLVVVGGCLVIEDFRIVRFNLHYDMSWRPALLTNHALNKSQLAHLWDKHLELSPAETQTIQQADILLDCHTNVIGLLALLPTGSDKPAVNIIDEGLPQYAAMSDQPAYRIAVKQRLQIDKAYGQPYRWVTIVSDKDVGPTTDACLRNIAKWGGTVDKRQPIDNFLGYDRLHFVLLSGTLEL